ncbi:MAG TPA: glycine C-acetyltransferase [Candidatus Cloacimonadota bacterium]|nr:glycine C-acetyltransferase [Candidatus Cloacimonadota bacterium]HPN40005.1 glycine C-acetyltransferase [Candidatus Cloacimonadota bacterium]
MSKKFRSEIRKQLDAIVASGMYKKERVLATPQSPEIALTNGHKVINFCANNYLGLSNHPEVIKASQKAMEKWGFGLSSVRFICGTQEIHIDLEKAVSDFLGMEDTILYSSCFDANGGVFEPLLTEESAIISDALNHASIIDGVRLCKAQRFRYKHSDMNELEDILRQSSELKFRLIVTDGVFSMDGDIALLPQICDLAEKYDALVMVDDSHATGYIGTTGRGTVEHCGVQGRVDIISTTFGKALGGASGGCISGSKEIIDFLRQKSRPYLFSNTLAPGIVGGVLKVMEMISASTNFRDHVITNANYFRRGMIEAGFDILASDTAIVPVMIYQEPLAVQMADRLLKEGIYVIGFTFPVVPVGQARIRVQLSAAHSLYHLDRAIHSFVKIGKELQVLK